MPAAVIAYLQAFAEYVRLAGDGFRIPEAIRGLSEGDARTVVFLLLGVMLIIAVRSLHQRKY